MLGHGYLIVALHCWRDRVLEIELTRCSRYVEARIRHHPHRVLPTIDGRIVRSDAVEMRVATFFFDGFAAINNILARVLVESEVCQIRITIIFITLNYCFLFIFFNSWLR